MNFYRYKSVDAGGKISSGEMEAANAADLEARLRKIGLDLINFKELARKRKNTGGRVRRRELITFFFHLEHMTKAGAPILESLEDLRNSAESKHFREVLSSIYENVEGGSALSQAMSLYPEVFGEVTVSLVRAGEQSGESALIYHHLSEDFKWQDEQATLLKKILIYPSFVITVFVGVLLFLMLYLVPELLNFIHSMQGQVPAHTRLLIFVSNLFVDYWLFALAAPVAIALALPLLTRYSSKLRYRIDACKLRLPLVGAILEKIIMARLAGTFAIMYAAGITILDCLKAGEDIAGNQVFRKALRRVGEHVSDGSSLSDGLAGAKLFSPMTLRMVRVGENSGALEEAFLNVGYFYTRDARERVERLQTIIEPTLTILLGVLIAWVMFSVLGPIYELIAEIQF